MTGPVFTQPVGPPHTYTHIHTHTYPHSHTTTHTHLQLVVSHVHHAPAQAVVGENQEHFLEDLIGCLKLLEEQSRGCL